MCSPIQHDENIKLSEVTRSDKWGYGKDAILRQWAGGGILYHERGKFTRVERFTTRTCRVVAIRV